MKILGKVALVTGAAMGLGRTYVEDLLARGAQVFLVDMNRETLQATCNDLRQRFPTRNIKYTTCDVTNKEQLKETYHQVLLHFGRLDIVVNNAGIADEENWERTIDVNLRGLIHSTYYAVEAMRTDKGGHGGVIINIASVGGLVPAPGMIVYGATKFGVVGFTRNMALVYKEKLYGIRFGCLCPSMTDTNLYTKELDTRTMFGSTKEEMVRSRQELLTLTQQTGVLDPKDVSQALMLLLEDDRSHGGVLTVTPRGVRYVAPRHLKGKL